MSAIDALYSLVEKFADSANIALHGERCLNIRFRALDCSLCADTCPAEGAITIADGKPSFDNDLCLQCGLCLHRCPTDAFTRRDALSGKLIQLMDSLPAQEVDLLCPQHPQPAQGLAEAAVQTLRCLAALSPSTLLALTASSRFVWLDDSHCPDCPLAYVHAAIEETAGRCNEWIGVLAGTPSIRLRSEHVEDSLPNEQRPVFDPAMSPISRRNLLRSLQKVGEKTTTPDNKVQMVKSGRSVPVSERLPQDLPPQHTRLITLVESRVDVGALPVAPAHYDLSVDESRCTGCTLCAMFCPTGALQIAGDDGKFELNFGPAHCLGRDCDICVLACPEDAICIPSARSPHLLFKRTELHAGNLTTCVCCDQPILDGPNLPETCFVCRPKTGLSDRDSAPDTFATL